MLENLDFILIDKLANAYGWTIEYMQSLEPQEITGLCKAIDERENNKARFYSYIVALGSMGETLDSATNKANTSNTENRGKEKQNTQEMLKMFQLLGLNANSAIKGIKEGKLEI